MRFIDELASDAVFDHAGQGRFRSFGEMAIGYYTNTEYIRTPQQIRRDEWIVYERIRCRAWMIIPTAVVSQFCLGSLYAWSMFNRPIDMYLYGDPKANKAQITFYFALGMLGTSGAIFGPWIESHSPRLCALLAAVIFFAGHCTAALGLACKEIGMLYFGYGFVGGVGLGIGYVTTIDAVIKWYPRSRGFASGLAVSGFGAGAVAFSNLNATLLRAFTVPQAFAILGAINLVVMSVCAVLMRPPHPDYNIPGVAMKMVDQSKSDLSYLQQQQALQQTIKGKSAAVGGQTVTVAAGSGDPVLIITLAQALASRDFWLMWLSFFVNLVFGVVIISNLASMTTNMFGADIPIPVATIVTIEGVFNASGRLLSGWVSDTLGRRRTFLCVISMQIVIVACLLVVIPQHAFWTFVVLVWMATLCYGGGVGVIAATLADMFGAPNMSSCHGVILTGWSVASIGGGLTYTGVVNLLTKRGGYTLSDPFVYVVNQYWILSLLACGWLALVFVRITPRERMFPRVHGQIFCHTLAGVTLRLARGTAQNGLSDYQFLASAPASGDPRNGNGIIDGDDSASSSNISIALGRGEKHLEATGQMEDVDLSAHGALIHSYREHGTGVAAHDAVTASEYMADSTVGGSNHEPALEAFNYVAADRKSMQSATADAECACVQLTCTTPPPRRCIVLFGRWRLEHVSSEEVATIWRMYLSCMLLASSSGSD
ncbi:hypothetical protein LPJ61_001862 [Coemansia biformis]|uniref:MFS general substrate transporter n=1 Tax=Coemansia biformis TaxID=1286918 RepID=A0A9W8CZ71_9FUNG|nr:hypothetical protein LPJ61_001862 [Coemansia biformis]